MRINLFRVKEFIDTVNLAMVVLFTPNLYLLRIVRDYLKDK